MYNGLWIAVSIFASQTGHQVVQMYPGVSGFSMLWLDSSQPNYNEYLSSLAKEVKGNLSIVIVTLSYP